VFAYVQRTRVMLIEKWRCESICRLSSRHAALRVNVNPKEEAWCCFSYRTAIFFYLWCDVWWRIENYSDDTIFTLFGPVRFSLMQQVFLSLVGVNHAVRKRFSRVTLLICLSWKFALCEVSCVALHRHRCHCGWHPTPLQFSLMQSKVTVWDQVQVLTVVNRFNRILETCKARPQIQTNKKYSISQAGSSRFKSAILKQGVLKIFSWGCQVVGKYKITPFILRNGLYCTLHQLYQWYNWH